MHSQRKGVGKEPLLYPKNKEKQCTFFQVPCPCGGQTSKQQPKKDTTAGRYTSESEVVGLEAINGVLVHTIEFNPH